jgi:hypothetical protein
LTKSCRTQALKKYFIIIKNEIKMKKVTVVYLGHAHNGEHYKFENDVLSVFTPELATTLNLSTQRAAMQQIHEKIGEVFRLNQAYQQTSTIQQLDHERDQRFSTFKAGVDFYQRGGTAAQQAAATAIEYVLKPYRKAAVKGYADNTAELGKLIVDIQTPTNAAHLATLGLTDAVAALKAINDQFDALFNSRSADENTRDNLEKIRDLRNEWDKLYRSAIVTVLPALYLVEQDADKKQAIGAAIDEIDGFVVELRKSLAHRNGGKSSAGSSETPSPNPPTDGDDNDDDSGDNGGGSNEPEPETPPAGGGDEGSGGPLDRNDIVININE